MSKFSLNLKILSKFSYNLRIFSEFENFVKIFSKFWRFCENFLYIRKFCENFLKMIYKQKTLGNIIKRIKFPLTLIFCFTVILKRANFSLFRQNQFTTQKLRQLKFRQWRQTLKPFTAIIIKINCKNKQFILNIKIFRKYSFCSYCFKEETESEMNSFSSRAKVEIK